MAEKDSGSTDGPSLELPSFGFKRKRGKDKATETTGDGTAEAAPTAGSPVDPVPPAPAPPAQQAPPPAARQTTPPPARPEPADEEPTIVLGATPGAEPPTEPAEPAPPASVPGAAAAAAAASRESQQAESDPGEGDTDTVTEPSPEPFRKLSLPELSGRQAAGVTGLVVGLLGVGASYLSLRLCSVIKGTTSCGGPGLLLLLAILIVLVIAGGALLRAFGVPDPTSTSFLAVGLLAVIALLFLVEVLLSWTMVIVIPVVAAVTYLLSHWVTTEFIEPARED
ncbi:hypothetical protein [Nocardioides sp.]|uniref:hypothetical protein n=1 Tax=Nocardioides sp. TaxID=35761 RepID=UPI002733C18B|nr:hypothetical protein [Nocardioides sp.]MDP3893653.1 hypothetical protein [Nocardioides sp.]